MPKVLLNILLCSLVWAFSMERIYAQPSGNDTLLLGAIVVESDTFAMAYLDEVTISDKLPKRLAKQRARYDRLRHNVTRVYPYAVIAAEVLKDVDVELAKLENDKKKRKEFLKSKERELNKRFKGELEDLTISQGQVLVKLIDRQTGKNCFNIIRELKGGFSAVVWQSVALLFSNSLKREYDGQGADREMELIVAELEASNYHKYQYRMQQQRIHN